MVQPFIYALYTIMLQTPQYLSLFNHHSSSHPPAWYQKHGIDPAVSIIRHIQASSLCLVEHRVPQAAISEWMFVLKDAPSSPCSPFLFLASTLTSAFLFFHLPLTTSHSTAIPSLKKPKELCSRSLWMRPLSCWQTTGSDTTSPIHTILPSPKRNTDGS